MSLPLVSVIIPCFNQAEFLAEAVDSALAQDYAPLEIVVVNDGSTDGTGEVARRYGDRVRYVASANRGLAGARNLGIANSTGALIALLDADDRWLPGKLAHQVRRMIDAPDVAMLFSSYRCFTPDGKCWTIEVGDGFRPSLHDQLHLNHANVPTAIFRRDVFDQLGGYDESLPRCEDWDLWIRIAAIAPLMGTSQVVAEYRRYPGTLSTNHRPMLDGKLKLLAKNRSLHPNCAGCERGYRLGVREAHAVYAASLCAESKRQLHSGRIWAATKSRAAGLWHNPRSPIARLQGKPQLT
jgi:glycosyltransferase involved in cell wall biosynthesis